MAVRSVRRWSTRATLGAALVLGYVCGGLPARAQTAPSTKTDELVLLINRARVAAGVLPLARNDALDAAAQAHSLDMVQHKYLDHTGSDGSEPQDRADKAGYHVPPRSAWIVVEVISAISADPQGPVDWWLNQSPDEHGRVLLNPRWREIGAGYAEGGEYRNYWTALFGCRPGVLPTVSLDGTTYTHTEECGDPSVAAAVQHAAPPPTPTPALVAPTPRLAARQDAATITVTWTDVARPSSTDWFGIYRPGDSDRAYQDWSYVACGKLAEQARASGSCSLPVPTSLAGAGTHYQIRLFSNNGYTLLARSDTLVNGTGVAQTTLQVSPEAAVPGGLVNVQWQGIPTPSGTDWIGLYRLGDADGAPIDWTYVGCARNPLDARPLGSCNLLLPKTIAAGMYQFRLFSQNGYLRLAVSTPIDVRSAS
jgi:uncharacterized protein YkwD